MYFFLDVYRPLGNGDLVERLNVCAIDKYAPSKRHFIYVEQNANGIFESLYNYFNLG